ncbi:MAG: hypothetical protein RJA90_504 [Bacteroidota bacterium]
MVLFIAPFYGTYLYLSLQQKIIQEAVQRKLEEGIHVNELVKLTFLKKEIPKLLKWEHDKEFEYDGQMYDVVEVTDVGDSLQYLCWWDKAETATKQNMQNLISEEINKSKPSKHKPVNFSDYYKSIYVFLTPCSENEIVVPIGRTSFSFAKHEGILSTEPPFPPPKICF